MTRLDSGALALTRTVLRVLVGLNWLRGGLIAGGLVFSFAAQDFTLRAIGATADAEGLTLLWGMRAVMVIGIAATPFYHVVLARVLDIVRTVGLGDPFIDVNAARLMCCAWALLWLQVMQFAVGSIAWAISSKARPIDIDPVSPSGWLAVLLLFVLAQVFRHGARMRDDLAGTV
jgi:hypothetical protein